MASGSSQSVLVAGLLTWWLLQPAAALAAAISCPADIDGDGQVTPADLSAVIQVVAGDGNAGLQGKTDVNRDGATTAADIVLVVGAQGPCPGTTQTPRPSATGTPKSTTPTASQPTLPATATPTPRSTPTAMSTNTATATPAASQPTLPATATPTATPAPVATATATMVCPTQVVVLGPTPTSIAGELVLPAFCQRDILNTQRPVDVYSVAGTPGTAIKIDVSAAAGSIAPYVVLSDAGGQFGTQDSTGGLPIEFYVTTSQPYEFMVASSSPTVVGSYTLTVSSRPCPAPVPLTFGGSKRAANLHGTECPDPGAPSTTNLPNPADIYSFTVTQVPTNVSITMWQSLPNDTLYATLSMRSPNLMPGGSWYTGLELVPSDIATDCSSDTLTCAQIDFLALQPGTYAIVASGGGGTGSYTLSVSSPSCGPTALKNIPADRALQCTDQNAGCGCSQESGGSSLCGGTFTSSTACAAPLQIPNISAGEPEDVASPADLYTFTASAGDVISVLMTADDEYSPGDAHLYFLGPAPGVTPTPGATPPNVLIAQDDNSGSIDNNGPYDAELAATLVQSGTYTIVAANNWQIDPASPVPYTLYIQKCPSHLLNGPVSGTFSGSECVGYGGIPYRSYGFATGHAGDFLSASVSSDTVDAFVRILGSDGSRVENDTDPFSWDSTAARASRILQQNGTYYIEVSTSLDGGSVDTTTSPPPGFTLTVQTAQTCQTKPATSGAISGTFGSSSCTLSTGQKFDVYTFTPASTPSVASVSPPSNGCVLNLLAEGPQTPDGGCSSETADMPLMSAGGYYGFIIAADDSDVTGAYTAQFRQGCPLASASFGDVITGTLSGTDCATADGLPAKWYLVHGAADLVQFNAPMTGTLAADFPFSGTLTDISGAVSITEGFVDDPSPPDPFFQFPLAPATAPPPPFGGDIGFLVRINGATLSSSDVGSYTLEVDPAWYTGAF